MIDYKCFEISITNLMRGGDTDIGGICGSVQAVPYVMTYHKTINL